MNLLEYFNDLNEIIKIDNSRTPNMKIKLYPVAKIFPRTHIPLKIMIPTHGFWTCSFFEAWSEFAEQ